MNRLGIFVLIFACCGCQSARHNALININAPKHPVSELIIKIDPFYNYGRHPDVRLTGRDASQFYSIIQGAPQVNLESIPHGAAISPAYGMSVIEAGNDDYYIMPNCEVPKKALSKEDRLKLYKILTKHTSYFKMPGI